MSDRHVLAVRSLNVSDVQELCRLLTLATQCAAKERKYPHQDAACRVISHHIAGVCNGDLPFLPHYKACYDYCCRMAELDALGSPDAERPPQPDITPQ